MYSSQSVTDSEGYGMTAQLPCTSHLHGDLWIEEPVVELCTSRNYLQLLYGGY